MRQTQRVLTLRIDYARVRVKVRRSEHTLHRAGRLGLGLGLGFGVGLLSTLYKVEADYARVRVKVRPSEHTLHCGDRLGLGWD